MLLVGFADFGRCLVVVQVVLLLSQRNAALCHVQNVLRGILLVGCYACAEESGSTILCQLQLNVEELLHGLGLLHSLNHLHDGCRTLLGAAHGVHSQLVEVRELLLHRSLGVGVGLQLFQDAVNTLVVVLCQTVETAKARIGSRQRVFLHPSTTGILIEIGTRLSCRVHVGQVKS